MAFKKNSDRRNRANRSDRGDFAGGSRKRTRYLDPATVVDSNDIDLLRRFVTEYGKIMPARDNEGAVRLLGTGMLPLTDKLKKSHQERIARRGAHENRGVSFQMVIDDIYAISKGRLVGRPRQ